MTARTGGFQFRKDEGAKPVEIAEGLEDTVEEVVVEPKEGDSGISSGLLEIEMAKGKVLFAGDSITRFTERELCKRDRRKRVRICLPGARI
ncbi:hypothetical protein HOLleu_15520 [Holothuria leucospilota]|uniref:Uncharacterized protein n=1 Tax=Holothuria leucospilota TaxID=206669 RepID=A0A9Q1CA83_HOLLE|nr:hypothetical protein HOLleu_15520 [Holothuria leucospilota]